LLSLLKGLQMINSVRNTVLSVLNKNNYGYISPSDFNLFAKQAQLDLFETYFYQYNYQINKENARQSGTGYADIRKGLEELIEVFSVTNGLVINFENLYSLPSPTTTGDDYYLFNKALVYQDILANSTTTAFIGAFNQVTDSTADFVTAGIAIGDIVAVENSGVQYVKVVTVDSATQLTVTGTSFDANGLKYSIYKKASKLEEAEKVTHSKITMLSNSILTSPTLTFPAYTQEANELTAYPNTIDGVGQIKSQYIRYPAAPKWTFITLVSGEPSFDQSQGDYQDFELPLDSEPDLVSKILQYAGMSIREAGAVQFGQSLEQLDNQSEQ